MAQWIGTNATGATTSDPDGSGTPNDMVKVAEYFYDLDHDRAAVTTEADYRPYVVRSYRIKPISTTPSYANFDDYTYVDTEYVYNNTNMETWSKPQVGLWSKSVSDYNGRMTESTVYRNGSTSLIVAQSTNVYGNSSKPHRLTESRSWIAKSDGGTPTVNIPTTYDYDDAERVIKTTQASGVFTKTEFDERLRTKRTVVGTDEGTDTTATTFTDDTIASEMVYTYDDVGNIYKVESYEIHDGVTANSGLLSALTADKSRKTTSLTWHDDAHRPTHQVAFGTGTPPAAHDEPLTDSAPNPNSSDDYLVSKTVYDDVGRVQYIEDNESGTANQGTRTRFFYDDMGRRLFTVENWDGTLDLSSGVTLASRNSDINRVTGYVYNAAGQITEQTAYDPNADGTQTDNQTTRYVFSKELSDKGSPVKSNGYLRAIIYPDSDDIVSSEVLANGTDTTYDRVERTYYANGQLYKRKDQRGVELLNTYDDQGRMTSQTVDSGTVVGDQRV
ncbi:MAG: hypothetical protein MI741_08240, partial [Rhodospirillales bacterium]|nr:hypothetical protein [Rhodospirillales bacterium]